MSTQTKTKLSIVREHMTAGRWQEAIRLAARFQQLGDQRGAILDAHAAYTNPRFMSQLGKDIDALKAAGHSALRRRFDK
jgi:hypothetical protein